MTGECSQAIQFLAALGMLTAVAVIAFTILGAIAVIGMLSIEAFNLWRNK